MDQLSAAQAVEELIRKYDRLVFHTIYGMTGDWEESQDLTQDTFQQAFKGIHHRPPADESLGERPPAVQPAGYGASASADPAELAAERDAVRRTLARLPDTLRECLILSITGNFSTHEIATMLDLQEAAVRQRLTRARKQFQQFYALENGDRDAPVINTDVPSEQSDKQSIHEYRLESRNSEYTAIARHLKLVHLPH